MCAEYRPFGTVLEWIILTAFVLYLAYRFYLAMDDTEIFHGAQGACQFLAALTNAPNPPTMIIADVRSHGYYDQGALRIKGSIRLEPNFMTSMLPDVEQEQEDLPLLHLHQ